jgi:hypothetical protein
MLSFPSEISFPKFLVMRDELVSLSQTRKTSSLSNECQSWLEGNPNNFDDWSEMIFIAVEFKNANVGQSLFTKGLKALAVSSINGLRRHSYSFLAVEGLSPVELSVVEQGLKALS